MPELLEEHPKATNTKSVNKTLAILSAFNELTPMQRTSDIAAKLNINISTASRHLNTLLDWGFLERDDTTGYYFPGGEILALAGMALQNNDVYRHAFPEVQRLSYKYGVHGHMGVSQQKEVIHLISSCCENTMDLLIPMGHRHPMHCSAMGRVLLAYMPPIKAQEILKSKKLKKYASKTLMDIQEINQELIQTRQKGYCLLINELAEATASLAAPIFDRHREVVAAISVSTSASSLRQSQREKELAKAVTVAANKISSKLGYYPK